MKRPFGFTLLTLLFVWLSLAGFAYAAAAPRAPAEQLRALGLNVPAMIAAGLLCGTSALASAVGLWTQARWAPRAVLFWIAALLLSMVSFQAMIGVAGEPWWLVGLPCLVFAAIALPIFRYVERKVRVLHAAI